MERVDLAILGATSGEISPLCGFFEPSGCAEIGGNLFSTSTYRSLKLLTGTTGLGKVNAAAIAAAAIESFGAAEVWNVGCAGAYAGSGLETGDVLISQVCICADEGILTKGGPMPAGSLEIPLVLKNGRSFYERFPLDEAFRRRPVHAMLPAGRYGLSPSGGVRPASPGGTEMGRAFRVRYGPSLTVSMASGDVETACARFERFGALAENMEGSAIAQTCLLFDVPFLEFRGISNMAGVRDKAAWNFDAAVKHCLAAVKHVLDACPPQRDGGLN